MQKTTLNYSCADLFQKQTQFDNVNIGIQIDKENSYAVLQKKKQLKYREIGNQSQQKADLRSNSGLQKSSSLQQFYRASSTNSYQNQKNTYAYLKDMKNQSYIQQLQQSSYQQRHISTKQVKEHNLKQCEQGQNNQSKLNTIEDKKFNLKLMKSCLEKQKDIKVKDQLEFNNQQILDNNRLKQQQQQGLLAKYFKIQGSEHNNNNDNNEKKQIKDVKQIYNIYTQIKDIKNYYTNSQKQNQEKKRIQLQDFITQLTGNSIQITQKLQMNNNNLIKSDRQYQLNDVKQTHFNKISMTQQSEPFLYYISSVIQSLRIKESNKYDEKIRDHFQQTYQGLLFANQLNLIFDDDKIVNLPRSNNLKTIVFDLDETLIHCNESIQIPGDVILPITFPNGETVQASINIRPYAQKVLQTLSKHFEIIIFTASHSSYANIVIDYLDPKRQWISHRLYRENCIQSTEGAYVKDLRVLGNRKLQNILLIDNASYSFGQQIDNGIPIISFYDNYDDQELLHLQNYLLSFRYEKDVRDLNQRMLKLNQFLNYQDQNELLQNLFAMYI